MPQYLFKGKYSALVTRTLILGFLIVLSSYFIHKTVFDFVNTAFNYSPAIANQNIWWTSITSGILSAPKVISAAAAIKLIKRWWLKQKEKERLDKEKLMTDLQLLKAQLHPGFLFSSLDSIYVLTQRKDAAKASLLLLKLADILSYMLYECDNKVVLLDKEIKIIKDYLLLEKTRMGDRLEIDVAVKGKTENKMVAPLLLFPFIESSFSYIDNKKLEKTWINLEFHVRNTEFTMKLIHGKTAEPAASPLNDETMAKAIKRLDFFYHGRYELKTTVEPEIMMTSLKIELDESMNENEDIIYTPQQTTYVAV
jgi:LytS/YehU family sensor histidine kinase